MDTSSTTKTSNNLVGPVLRMVEDVDAIISAIREDNPDKEIEVIYRAAYVRVQADGYLRVTRDTIERHIGRSFPLYELEKMLSSFAGRIKTSTDDIVWKYGA